MLCARFFIPAEHPTSALAAYTRCVYTDGVFTWDEQKRHINRKDHRLDFADAEEVFAGTTFTFNAMDQVDKLAQYRRILQQVVEQHAQAPRRADQVPLVPICDTVHDNYLLMRIGWDSVGRARNILFHFRLLDGKVWIEWDGIEHGIAYDLLEAGIPAEDIVLAFYGKQPLPLTQAAAAGNA